MTAIHKTQVECGKILGKAGLSLFDLPYTVCFDDWVDDDFTDKEIKDIAPDICWEILDNADMDRDLVNSICYPEAELDKWSYAVSEGYELEKTTTDD